MISRFDLLGNNTQWTWLGWFLEAPQLQEITAGGLKIDSQISQLVQAWLLILPPCWIFDPTASSVHTIPMIQTCKLVGLCLAFLAFCNLPLTSNLMVKIRKVRSVLRGHQFGDRSLPIGPSDSLRGEPYLYPSDREWRGRSKSLRSFGTLPKLLTILGFGEVSRAGSPCAEGHGARVPVCATTPLRA